VRARFHGVYVPIVTPFRGDDVADDVLAAMIDHLIDQGATGLVPTATTGECATLSHEEHLRVVEMTVQMANGRVPVIAGAGSNSTTEAIHLVTGAEKVGADAVLMMSPYYNRPSQQGMVEHFRVVAQATRLPIILYNIPKRTGQNMDPETIIELSRVDNIVGLKDCCGDPMQTMRIIEGAHEFSVLTGDDPMLFPTCCLGGTGGIMTSAHVLPGEWKRIVDLLDAGQIAEARAVHYKLLPIARVLFSEASPGPVKAAMELMGFAVGPPRLPMTAASPACRERVRAELERVGAI
jgi:4-hydroxy-tetrahydrodipicolinate synthase